MWKELDQEEMTREESRWRREPWSSEEIEQLVVMEQLHRYNHDLPCGALALRKRLQEHYNVQPLPSVRWIGQVLIKQGLSHHRTGWYEGEEHRRPEDDL